MEENYRYKDTRKQTNAYNNWVCPFCNNVFRTRRLLNEHKKLCDLNKSVQRYIIDENGKRRLAPGCHAWNKGLTKETNTSVKNTSIKLSNLFKGRQGHKHTEETKKKLSEIRKKQIKESGGIWWNSRSKCKRSYAEEWTKKVLENELKDNTFVEEFHIGKWFLDFAWPNKKIGLEIDGSQHEWLERKKNDEEKDSFCLSQGWKILRLKWKDICNNTQLAIKIIKEFVKNNEIIEYEFVQNQNKIKKGPYRLDEKIWEERKEKILNCDVDLMKYGWIEKVIIQTGLTKRNINQTIKHFEIQFSGKYFKRK